MESTNGPNVWLIGVTFGSYLAAVVYDTYSGNSGGGYIVEKGQEKLFLAFVLVWYPIKVLWFKALWNDIIPRVTTWRKISWIEALGVFTTSTFLLT